MKITQGVSILLLFGGLYVLAGWQPQIAVMIGGVVVLGLLVKTGRLVALKHALG